MKTVTEFRGISLKEVFEFRHAQITLRKAEDRMARLRKTYQEKAPAKDDSSKSDEKKEEAPVETKLDSEATDATQETIEASSGQQTGEAETADAEASSEQDLENQDTSSDPAQESTPSDGSDNVSSEELSVSSSEGHDKQGGGNSGNKEAREKRFAEEKEEIKNIFKDRYDLDDEKLEIFMSAIDVVDFKRARDLRKVTVFEIEEGEKPPAKSVQKGKYYFVADYLASLGRPGNKRFGRGRGGPGGGRGRGRGKGGGRGRGGRNDRNNRNKPGGGGRPNWKSKGKPGASSENKPSA